MSSNPPVVRRPNEFGSAGNSPLTPPPPKSNKTANYIVGCFGVLLLGFVVLIGVGALIVRGTSVSSRKKIEESRPDVEQTGSLPSELRSVISNAGAKNKDAAENARKWVEADQQKLETLLKLLDEEDVEAIDMDRLVEELSHLAPLAVLPFTKALWRKNLGEVIVSPDLTGGIKCIDVRWIGESEARAILVAPNYDIQSLMIAYLHETDGELKVYDWRETLEPMSEVEYWAYYAILDEPECYSYSELIQTLDALYYDESVEESVRAARLLATYRKNPVPTKWRGLGQNIAATYLHFSEDSQTELQELARQMNPADFAGAYLWQARACQDDDPKRAFQLAMKAMNAVGWHPAATDIVLQTIDESGDDARRAGGWIAQSLQHGTLRASYMLLSSDAAVIDSVVESLFERCSSSVASERLLNLIVETYVGEAALKKLDAALANVSPSELLSSYLRYSQTQMTGSVEAEFEALAEVVKSELPEESRENLLEDFLSMSGTAGKLPTAFDQLEASGFYDADEIESILAKSIANLQPDSSWQLEAALERLVGTSTMVQAARAILLYKLEQPEKAFEVLLELWPEREAELVDAEIYYDLDYTYAATDLLGRLAIELGREDEFIERSADKSVAVAALANSHFATGNLEALRQFLSQAEHEVAFRPYYEALCRLWSDPDTAAEAIAEGLEWVAENAGDDEDWPALDFVWATAPHYGEAWELRYDLANAAVDAGIMPAVLDAASPSTRSLVVTDDLNTLFSNASDRKQLLQVLDRVRKVEDEAARQVQHELETRAHVLAGSPEDAARAKIAELETSDYRYLPSEDELIAFLAEIGRLDLASAMLEELTPDMRSEEFDDWRQLCQALLKRDGKAIGESSILGELSWTTSLPMIEAMSEADLLVAASAESSVSSFSFNAPSVLLKLDDKWQSLESEVAEGFGDWTRVQALERFPESAAVWTRFDDAGHWTAAVYDGMPPGIDSESVPSSMDASASYLLVSNCPNPKYPRKELAVHSYVVSNFAERDWVAGVYTPASAITWPEETWPAAIRQYVDSGKLDIRWMSYSSGWRAYWLKYGLAERRSDEVSRFNFGGIVENIPREPVSQLESRGDDADAYGTPPTHKLVQPSICFPALKAGVYVR